jgi:hypothetical protein
VPHASSRDIPIRPALDLVSAPAGTDVRSRDDARLRHALGGPYHGRLSQRRPLDGRRVIQTPSIQIANGLSSVRIVGFAQFLIARPAESAVRLEVFHEPTSVARWTWGRSRIRYHSLHDDADPGR